MSIIGELNYFLDLQIKQQREGVFICQLKYTRKLLKRFSMEKAKACATMSPLVKLDLDESGKKVVVILFRGMISSLVYLITSKPNIMFSVYMCTLFQANPNYLQ